MIARQPTLTERLAPHRRKRIGTCLRDDALINDIFEVLGVHGAYSLEGWAAVLRTYERDTTLLGTVLDAAELI